MNLIFICCFTITLLFTFPLVHCKPKKGNYRGKYPNTLKPRRRKQKKEGKAFKPVDAPNTKSKDQTTSTPTAETPGCPSSRRAKSKSKEPSLEPTQNTDKSHPLSVMKTQEPTITKRVASKEPSTAKEKSNMKTARRFIPPRKEEYWEDQNEDETLLCVKSIE
ncbi:hypothetical protein CAEBREN_06150 [Caenorhabditis brenneri]|uniref:Uncharacterized protein n=1 Tax=Caenorhabditis brenneri TaxID=135651 RepID=G0PHE8_CAEBE|nr:hypothetical protein CAEBREN_06150 [Caenorhabditis brenneri]